MARPIILTDENKQQMLSEFSETLDKAKMSDGELKYQVSFKYESGKAAVLLTLEAYRKIVALVTNFSDEVAWHGTVTRSGECEFVIEDIFVYPQEVTGSTVVTDQEEYTKWLYEQTDEVFNKIRMQGHSHVNMGVNPSGVDDTHRKQILEQLEPNMFYIFQIWNKSLSVHTLIFDMKNNILYENNDIEIKLLTSDGVDDFLSDAHEKVRKTNYAKHKKKSRKQEQLEMEMMFDEFDLGGEAWRH